MPDFQSQKCSSNCNEKVQLVECQSKFFNDVQRECYCYTPGDSDQEMFKKINNLIKLHSESKGLTAEAFDKLTDEVMKKSKLVPPVDRSERAVTHCYENNNDEVLKCASVVRNFYQTISEVSMDILKTYQV